MASQALSWGLALIVTIALPRHLGAEAVGQLRIGTSLWAVAGMAVAFGTPLLLTKEFPRDRLRASSWAANAISLQLLLYGVCWVGMAGFVAAARYPSDVVIVIGVIGFSAGWEIWSRSARAALYGLERMDFVAYADVLTKVVYVAAVLFFIVTGGGLVAIATTTVIYAACSALALGWFSRRLQVDLRPRLSRVREVARRSRPYALIDVALVAYMQVDSVIISLLVPHAVLGWYAAADGLVGSLLFVPTILMTSLFPVMSRMHHGGQEDLTDVLRRAFNFLLLMAVPIGLGTAVVGGPLALLIFGEGFAGTGPVLTLFGPVLVVTYITILLGRYAIAVDRQRFWLWLIIASIALTVVLDLLLVPVADRVLGNGAIGGVLAYLVTESLMLVIGVRAVAPQLVSRSTAIRTAKCAIAGIVMVAVVWPLRREFVAVPILAGAVSYPVMVIFLRTLDDQELAMVRAAWRRVWARLRRRDVGARDSGGRTRAPLPDDETMT